MSFQTLGWLSAFLFLTAAGGWFLVINRERRRDERTWRELRENVARLPAYRRMKGIVR